jgi:hypothetical protein
MAPSEFEDITPHVVMDFVDGLPFAYQRSVLRVDPDRVEETLAEIEAIAQRPASTLKSMQLQPRPDKGSGFLELAGPAELDARTVRETLLDQGLTAAVALDPVYVADEPDPTRQFGGLPAKEGHGTMRAGLLLVGVAPPPRSETVPDAGRRPVVAVLDTPVREHPWLGDGEGDDPFWSDGRRVEEPWRPYFAVPEESSNGRLSHAGHGTFIAGLVRLLAPDARVLSVPVMHGNGVVEEEHVLHALGWLRDRVTQAVDDGRPELFVDVVNLSFGRYELEGRDPADTAQLREVLADLARRGVQVVTSAGNRPVETKVFPAAFDGLVSVGARDPDGTLAAYTSTGGWVTVQAPGTSLVSALPKFDQAEWPQRDDLDASGLPMPPDPNFQASLVGQWSGTSFAAAWVSASIAAKLLEQATRDSLADVSPEAAGVRARSAFEAVAADLERWVASHDFGE